MHWLNEALNYLNNTKMYGMRMDLKDVVEIIIIAFLVYYILAWMKATRAWLLLKGMIVIGVFLLLAFMTGMTTIV